MQKKYLNYLEITSKLAYKFILKKVFFVRPFYKAYTKKIFNVLRV